MSLLEIMLAAFLAPGAEAVARKAAIAADAPYCIQVADGNGGYRPAETLRDLATYSMQGQSSGGIKLHFHAVLAVGNGPSPRVFSWSYRQGNFQEIGHRGAPAVSCAPRRDFAGRLSLWASAAGPDGPKRLRVAGQDFTIPAAYALKVTNELHNPVLVLDAAAPHC